MYAIVETGAKQYRVSKNDIMRIELIGAEKGKEVKLDRVLLISDKKNVSIGNPYIKGSHVICDVIGQERAKKVISFKYRRRRASSKKKIGHRQNYSILKVKEIVAGPST